MITRCKFKCIEAKNSGTAEEPNVEVSLSVVGGDTPENKEFFKYTPGGVLRFYSLRRDVFVLNREYYADFTEAERDEANDMLRSVRDVAVAVEADNISLRAALRAAEFCMEGDDNVALCPMCVEDGGGHLTHAPDCIIGKALARPVGSVEVLRERLVLAWEAGYLRGCGGCNPTDGPPWDEDDCRNRDAAIARLLEPRSDTPEADKKGAEG